jgi:hypothetical protein
MAVAWVLEAFKQVEAKDWQILVLEILFKTDH